MVCDVLVLFDFASIRETGLSSNTMIEVTGKCITAKDKKTIEPDPDFLYYAIRPADMGKGFA
jgi:hypothetical protein